MVALAPLIYYQHLHNKNSKRLFAYKAKNIDVNKIIFKNLKLSRKRNIYVVILESFIDPRLIKDAKFNPSPLSKNMMKYLHEGNFSYTISPIYGGGTAQAEFEILTAVPALTKINSIEFNSLEGNKIPGFINLLKQNGYHTYANIATSASFYNSKDAYKSIGFDKTNFLIESKEFKKREGDIHIFDGDLYQYNIKKMKEKTYKKPYILYALGMYGHFPYDRNKILRPDIIKTTCKDKRVKRIVNQFYYRTKSLGDYIDSILKVDPKSIILISSDHIPPLLNHGVKYKRSKYENISLLLVDGKPINIDTLRYYEIPRVIINILKNRDVKIEKIDNRLIEEIYFKTISEGMSK